jgi:hypothetical protein
MDGFRTAAALALTLALPSLALAASPQAPAPGQGRAGAPPPPPQNLQVLRKDIPRAELIATMRTFTQGLGVQCEYCHVEEPSRDFASDAKAPKKTARLMMQMVGHVNEMIAGGVGKPAADVVKVQCVTCHRGEAIPKNPPPAPAQAPGGAGAARP